MVDYNRDQWPTEDAINLFKNHNVGSLVSRSVQ